MKVNELPENIKQRCLANSKADWKMLFESTFQFSKSIARGEPFVLDPYTAEDIAQKTILDLAGSLEEINNISSFVRIATRNKCIDYIRKKNPAKPNAEEYISEEKDDESSFSKRRDDYNILFELKNHVQSMDHLCKYILYHRFYDGYKYRDISEKMAIPISQVGVRISRCLSTVKKQLTDKFPDLLRELKLFLNKD